MKHNKKRNTAFLFEVLSREIVKCVMKRDEKRKKTIITILKEHFKPHSELQKELEIYNALLDATKNPSNMHIERLMLEARRGYALLNAKELVKQKTALIHRINRHLSPDVYDTFVPNYRLLATVSQLLASKLPIKKRIVLEQQFIDACQLKESSSLPLQSIDTLVHKEFCKKFNQKFSSLLQEQKTLLNYYIVSFSDNSLGLRNFLNLEIGRLKPILESGKKVENVDNVMQTRLDEVLKTLDSFKLKQDIEEKDLQNMLKIQSLAAEILG